MSRKRKGNMLIDLAKLLNKEIKKVSDVPSNPDLIRACEFDSQRHSFTRNRLGETLGRDVSFIVETYYGIPLPKLMMRSQTYEIIRQAHDNGARLSRARHFVLG